MPLGKSDIDEGDGADVEDEKEGASVDEEDVKSDDGVDVEDDEEEGVKSDDRVDEEDDAASSRCDAVVSNSSTLADAEGEDFHTDSTIGARSANA